MLKVDLGLTEVGGIVGEELNRREVAKKLAVVIGGVATVLSLPASWTKPTVVSIAAPAQGVLSPFATTTPAPTTTQAANPV